MSKDKIILTQKEWIPDINGNKVETTVIVYYDRNSDIFYTPCPAHLCKEDTGCSKEKICNEEVTETIPDGVIYADKPQKVIDKLLYQSRCYLLAVQKKRKVIAYRFTYDEDDIFRNGVGFFVEWSVGWELKVGDRTELLSHEPSDKPNVFVCNQTALISYDKERMKVIDWTEKRANFFRGLEKAINGLKDRCRGFFDDENKLVLAIDMGKSPLLLEGEKCQK